MEKMSVAIYLCTVDNELFSEKENWHKNSECTCNAPLYATAEVGKELPWSNGKAWGVINHPYLGDVMTYWNPERPCYDTWTTPTINDDGEIVTFRYDQDEGCWASDDGEESLGLYNGIDTCKFA